MTIINYMFQYDEVLDPHKLHQGLLNLVQMPGWRKAGGRIRVTVSDGLPCLVIHRLDTGRRQKGSSSLTWPDSGKTADLGFTFQGVPLRKYLPYASLTSIALRPSLSPTLSSLNCPSQHRICLPSRKVAAHFDSLPCPPNFLRIFDILVTRTSLFYVFK